MAKRKATTKKIGQEFWKQRERVLRRVREIEKRGYIVDRTIIPDLPDKISAKDVKALKDITPNYIYKHSDFVTARGEILRGYAGRKLERQQAAYEGIIKHYESNPILNRKTAEKVRKARKFLETNPKNEVKGKGETEEIEAPEIPELPDITEEKETDIGEEPVEPIKPTEKKKEEIPREADVVVDNLGVDLGISEEELLRLEGIIDEPPDWGRTESAQALHDFNNAKAGDVLTRALRMLGREQVAKNIQNSSDRIFEIINIIRMKYKASEVASALAEFQQILMGGFNDDEWFQEYQNRHGEWDYNEY